jgi:hypothetical protein
MKKWIALVAAVVWLTSAALAQFSFYLIDNFESGKFNEGPKWWRFGNLKVVVVANPTQEARDVIAQSCGEYALNVSGDTNDYYIGGIGTDLNVDAADFTRFQIDISGNSDLSGKLKIEFFDDDNLNYTVEQDPQNNYMPVYDDKWVAEINIQGKGFTRTSIPFSAFRDVNPGVGDDTWNPEQANGSGGLAKLQIVAITAKQSGKLDFEIDNLLLTY